MHPAFIWTISLASILLMLVRPRGLAEWVWICSGAAILLATRLLPLAGAFRATNEALDVCLFLTGMMILAELAREEGVFDWVAEIALRHARGSAGRLFFLVYAAGAVVTIFLSNDATAVVLTPAVLAAARRARVHARPHLLACAMVANAASFVLPISNPANLVVFGKGLPPLFPWLRHFAAPSLAAIVATYLCLWALSRYPLAERTAPDEEPCRLSAAGRIALAGIVIAAGGLLVASAFGVHLGAPTCGAALLVMALVAVKDRGALQRSVRNVSWSVLPLVLGLFMIVEALNRAGMMRAAQGALVWLNYTPDGLSKFIGGAAVALLSNGMNNLPVGLAAGSALRQTAQHGLLAHAVLIGVDLGPNLSVTGSLATILWLITLRREQEEITAWQFLRAGALVMPVSLALALLALR
ncbi:MAG TPA: SLC13 family permease [Acidobacteriaceae bacterium]